MIAADIPRVVRDQVAEGIQIEASGDGGFSIYMPFIYDDGDHCGFALNRVKGGWRLTDHGEVVRRAGYASVDLLEEGYVERFRKIVGFYGLTEASGKLSLAVTDDSFSEAIFSFTQACLEVLNLAKVPKERHAPAVRKNFNERLSGLIEPIVPEDRIIRRWADPSDTDRIYTADYRIEGSSDVWLVYGVPSPLACMTATISCQHHRMKEIPFKGLAIYDHEEEIRQKYATQLNDVVDKRFPHIGARKTITEFLKKIAK